jgi:hypothetical protein
MAASAALRRAQTVVLQALVESNAYGFELV